MPEPTWGMLLGRGLPTVLIEGIVPVLLFYAIWRTAGLAPAAVATSAAGLAIVAWQARRGTDTALVWATGCFLVIQAVVALITRSATVYLAQPVVLSVLWGIAYFGSVAIGRPLVGALARGWYPFPPEFRATAIFRREFALQSIVWGVYCLARAGLRLGALLSAGVGGMLVITFLTGTPLAIVLILWGVWHARRTFGA
jgi:hypothetical protein